VTRNRYSIALFLATERRRLVEKQIVQITYWLGLASSLLALVWKGLEALGVAPEAIGTFKYMTFYKGGLLFLLISMATAVCAWVKSLKA